METRSFPIIEKRIGPSIRELTEEILQENLVAEVEATWKKQDDFDPNVFNLWKQSIDKNTDVGAINSAEQLHRIRELVESGVSEGAKLYQSSCSLPDKGFWFKPSFFTNVTASHRVAREEIFGPVLSVMTFRTPAEAIERANNTCYGLSAGIWTDKGSKIFKMAGQLKAGVIWANTFNKFDPTSPFGGYKESGFGREGGVHGLAAYLQV